MAETEPELKIGDIVTMDVTVVPKWWQIWKKPYSERQKLIITAVTAGGATAAYGENLA